MPINVWTLSYSKIVTVLCILSISSFYISYDLTRWVSGPQKNIKQPAFSLHRGIVSQLRRLESQKEDVPLQNKISGILKKISVDHTNSSDDNQHLVVIKGNKFAIQKNSVYLEVLGSLNIPYRIFYDHGNSKKNSLTRMKEPWERIICLTLEENNACFEPDFYKGLNVKQTVNKIPGLQEILKDKFSEAIFTIRKIKSVQKCLGVPLVFSLPEQRQLFSSLAELVVQDANWLIFNTMGMSRLPTNDILNKLKNNELDSPSVILEYFEEPFLITGQYVILKLFVIVTSIHPLRLSLYDEGVVLFYEEKNSELSQVSDKMWSYSKLTTYITEEFGRERVDSFRKMTVDLIGSVMIVVDNWMSSLYGDDHGEVVTRCVNCYQLLSFDVVWNASLAPSLIRTAGLPQLPYFANEEFPSSFYKNLIVESLQMTNYSSTHAHDIADFLEATSDYIGIMGHSCQISHELCLNKDDISQLSRLRHEMVKGKGFHLVYPSTDSQVFQILLDRLHESDVKDNYLSSETARHNTRDTHQLMTRFVNYFRLQKVEQISDSMNSPFLVPVSFAAERDRHRILNMSCDQSPATLKYLRSVTIHPTIALSPTFSPTHLTYYGKVPYDIIFIQILAEAANCQGQARIEDKFGPSGAVNYTLGLGENKITINLVDLRHSQPKIVNTYYILLTRQSLVNDSLQQETDLSVCGLVQDCDMRISAKQVCGLHEERAESIEHHRRKRMNLPVCETGEKEGRWVIPCSQCSTHTSCLWFKAEWQPYSCRYQLMKQKDLKTCLAGKKILFLGDSTNRGIFYYIIQKINGTIYEWDKTHDYKSYNNINDGQTYMAFSYYPQFWLPSNKRPVFDQSLYHLLLKSRGLENSSNTILVVGGVQWLSTQHLHMLLSVLKREKLQGIRVFIKSLGSGFHTPLLYKSSFQDQEKLLSHSKSVIDYALQHGLEVIDTFNMTLARYKDFLNGKCACHFHQVLEAVSKDNNTVYHIEGDINAAYTEILLSLLCTQDNHPNIDSRSPT